MRTALVRGVAVLGVSCAAAGAAAPPGTIVYTGTGDPGRAEMMQWSGSAWLLGATVPAAADEITWQAARSCPARDETALVTLDKARNVIGQVHTGGAWGSRTVLCADAGNFSSQVFAAQYESSSGDLIVAYRKGANTSLYYRVFAGGAWGAEQTFAMSLNGPPRWVELAPKPGSDEMVLLVATETRLYGAVWNGASFGNQITLGSGVPSVGRPFAATYCRGSGECMVNWDRNSGRVNARRWTGSSWTAETDLASGPGNCLWIASAGSPAEGSNEVLLAVLDDAADIRVNRWTGAAWSGWTTAETNAGAISERRVDVSYEPGGARAVLAWHASGATDVKYRVWNGTSWSSTAATASVGGEVMSLRLAPGPDATGVTLLAHRRGTPTYTDYVAYASGGSISLGSNTKAYGLTGSKVSGVTLPACPAGSAGSPNYDLGNNQTRTLAPGAYGYVKAGNSFTLNLSAGTYYFQYFDFGNSARINADASGGDVVIVLTNGNFQADNNLEISTTGAGRVRLHIRNGNLSAGNNAEVDVAQLTVHNGNVEVGNNADVTGAMYASGNVEVGNGSVLTLGGTITTGPGRLEAFRFSSGVPGSAVTISASMPTTGTCDPFDVCAPGVGASGVRVIRWHEVGPGY